MRGGKDVTVISNKTDYVIFPNKITKRERRNKQIENLYKIYNTEIQFLNYKWIIDCLENCKLMNVDKYKIDEFYEILNKKTLGTYSMGNVSETDPFYKDIISNVLKCWVECVNDKGVLYYYCTLTGLTTYNPPNDYTQRLFGGISITDPSYYTEPAVIKKRDEIETTVKELKRTLEVLTKYEGRLRKRLNTGISNRKRKREQNIKNLFERCKKRFKSKL